MFSISSNDGELLAMLTESIELVGESCLKFLAGDVGELGFSNERFGFGTDQFLFEDDDAWAIWFFVFELGDLIGDFLLAFTVNVSFEESSN